MCGGETIYRKINGMAYLRKLNQIPKESQLRMRK
jgi:hypothetical protein